MFQFNPKGTITITQGFKTAGVHCGIKKRKKNIALTYSDIPGDTAGVHLHRIKFQMLRMIW